MAILLREHHAMILSLIWGTLAEAARTLIRAQVRGGSDAKKQDDGNFTEIYQLLYDHFGDALCTLPLSKVRRSRQFKTIPEKEIVGKLKIKGLPGRQAKKRNPSGMIETKDSRWA